MRSRSSRSWQPSFGSTASGWWRRRFNDTLRQAHVGPVISKALIGHLSDEMREHYSTVRLDEKRAAVASAWRLLPGSGESADNGAGHARQRHRGGRRNQGREVKWDPPDGAADPDRKCG